MCITVAASLQKQINTKQEEKLGGGNIGTIVMVQGKLVEWRNCAPNKQKNQSNIFPNRMRSYKVGLRKFKGKETV